MTSGGKGWQAALNSCTGSCAQTKENNAPENGAPREQWSRGSSVSAHQGCAFRRGMRMEGDAGIAWSPTPE